MHSSGPKCKFRVITDVNSGVFGWYSGVFHDLKTPEYPLKTPQYPLLHLAAHLQYTPKHSSGPEYNIFSITDVNSGVCGGYSGLFQCYKEVSPPPSPQLPIPLPPHAGDNITRVFTYLNTILSAYIHLSPALSVALFVEIHTCVV